MQLRIFVKFTKMKSRESSSYVCTYIRTDVYICYVNSWLRKYACEKHVGVDVLSITC